MIKWNISRKDSEKVNAIVDRALVESMRPSCTEFAAALAESGAES